MKRKYLCYYCAVNWCYCDVCASMNLSICNMDKQRIDIQFDIRHYFTQMKIDIMYLLVYSRDYENCSPSSWHYSRCSLDTGILMECVHWYMSETMRTVPLLPCTVHNIHYIQVYRHNVSVGIFQRLLDLFPLFPGTIHDVHYI